jgi:hypothetical protein
MCRAGLVWATGTEDMDALTFGTPILLRHLTFSEARKVYLCASLSLSPISLSYLSVAYVRLSLSSYYP